MCFSPYLGIWCREGGVQWDWYTICLCTFPSLYSSKIEVCNTYFFDIVITSNDHPRYKACFSPYLCSFYPILGAFCLG